MKRRKLILLSRGVVFLLGILLGIPFSSLASCTSYTDSFGNTDISCLDGTRGNLYTDSFGNTFGSYGDKQIDSYTDSFGDTSGFIGEEQFDAYSDDFGNTGGQIGGSPFDCYTDGFGNTDCW